MWSVRRGLTRAPAGGFGRRQWPVVEWCERKILLVGWYLEAGAETVWKKNTVELEVDGAAEHSKNPLRAA